MKLPAAALCLISIAFADTDRKVNLFTAIDLGRLENGKDQSIALSDKEYDPSGLALNRTYVDVTVAHQVDVRNFVSIGVGGIFWKAFEQETGEPEAKVIHFGPGISNAFYKFTPNEALNLTLGYFPYKYNPSARNLGEYLFRTEAYPTVVFNGGWSWLNSASYNAVGLKLTHQTETFTQDIGLFGEYFNAPIYDVTPAYLATWKPTAGFTLGGGVALHRYLSPNTAIRKELTREYTYYENFYVPGKDSADGVPARPARRVSMLKTDIETMAGNDGLPSDAFYNDPNNTGAQPKTVRFDNQAVMLMAHATLDFNGLLGWEAKSVGAFELYGEIALLGLKNYPIFYTKFTQRMPIMLGMSIPTLGMLDHLSLELEYLNNPNIQSIYSTFDVLDLAPDLNFRYQEHNRDNLKWSVHASRNLTSFLSLYVQLASDHMRLKDKYARPEYIPITNNPKEWYWLTRLQWAI
jgi:hypothetical protein